MSTSKNPFPEHSGHKNGCMEMLQTILDGAATQEQEAYFKQHMDECMPCYKNYQVEMQIRQLIKTKCSKEQVPAGLIESIKHQVNSIS